MTLWRDKNCHIITVSVDVVVIVILWLLER